MAVLDLRDGTLRYCNAGHDKPYVLAPGTAPRELGEIGAPPLCIVEGFEYETRHHRLASGELVCLFSDGVTEALDVQGQEFGEERLIDLVQENRDRPLQQIAEIVTGAVDDWIGGLEQPDDVTLVLARAR